MTDSRSDGRGARRRPPAQSPAELAASRRDLWLAAALLIATFCLGGASRADALSQLPVRLFALLAIAGVGLLLTRERWARARGGVLFLGTAALLMALQLVPLPPALWAALPGHDFYAGALRLIGLDGRWRPISLTPDLTLNSLLALLPAVAAALVFGTIEPRPLRALLPVLLVGIGASALLSLAQLTSGGFYLYNVTNQGAGVGVFANRNHQALLLAMAFPLLAGWSALGGREQSQRLFRLVVAGSAAVAIFPFLLITGSRAGLIEGVVGAGLTALLFAFGGGGSRRPRDWKQRLPVLAPVAIGLIVLAVALSSSRDVAFGRLLQTGSGELRADSLPTIATVLWRFFPLGAGFGSFDPVYRTFEPDALLSPAYLNHAHSDLIEIAIEGGVLAWALLAAFMWWFARAAWTVARGPAVGAEAVMGRVGLVGAVLTLIGSLVDYPLRTPLASVAFVLCCTWLRAAAVGARRTGRLATLEG